jgi:hypothetical protein
MSCVPRCVSSKGSVIAGSVDSVFLGSFVWDVRHGSRDLQQLLTDYGLDLVDWEELTIEDMSDDGRVLVGQGLNLTIFQYLPFRVTLPVGAFD